MTRYASNTVTSNVGAPIYHSNVLAGEDIPAGEVVVLCEDDRVYVGKDPALNNPLRPIFNPKPLANYPLSATPAYVKPLANHSIAKANLSIVGGGASGTNTMCGAVLSNGSYVVAWIESSYNICFALFNSEGVQQGVAISVNQYAETQDGYVALSIAALTGGGFVLAFSRQTMPFCAFVVVNNAGVIGAQTTVVNDTALTNGQVHVAALSNGGFVLAHMINNAQLFAIYNAAGAIQGAQVGIVAAVGFSSLVSFNAAQGGGFAIVHTVAGGFRLKRFNNAGVQVGAMPTMGANAAYPMSIAALENGSVAITSKISDAQMGLCVVDSDGVLVVPFISFSPVAGSIQPRIAALKNGNFAVAHGQEGAGVISLSIWSSNCVLLKSFTSAELATLPHPTIVPLKSGGFAIYAASGGKSHIIDERWRLLSTATLPAPFQHAGNAPPVVISLPYIHPQNPNVDVFAMAAQVNTAGVGLSVNQLCPSILKCVPLGVSVGSALKGESLKIQYSGAATLSKRFLQSYKVNAQSLNGQNMSVLGDSVLMQGVIANEVRRSIS